MTWKEELRMRNQNLASLLIHTWPRNIEHYKCCETSVASFPYCERESADHAILLQEEKIKTVHSCGTTTEQAHLQFYRTEEESMISGVRGQQAPSN